ALWVGRGGLSKAAPKPGVGPAPTAEETARFAREADTLVRKLAAPGATPGVMRATGPSGVRTIPLEKVESLSLSGDRVVFVVRATATTSALYAARRSHAEEPPAEPETPHSNSSSRTTPLVASQAGAHTAPQDALETPIDEGSLKHIREALEGCADKAYGDTLA